MLTDAQALSLIEDMRRNTHNTDVAALCDWVLALVQRREKAPKPKADRRAYMRDFMRKRRAEQRRTRKEDPQ